MWKKWFGFNPQTMKIHTEVMAGITSFLAMAYILAVNPAILSATGMDKGALFTTTALAAIIGTLVMALWAKMPFALAPGMGLNAFFAFTVCLQMGNSWQFALTAVFIEGLIFIILTLTKLRQAIVNAIPATLRQAIGVGIGLFIAFIGLINCHIVVPKESTLVTIGDLTHGNDRDYRYGHTRHQKNSRQPTYRYSAHYTHRYSYGYHPLRGVHELAPFDRAYFLSIRFFRNILDKDGSRGLHVSVYRHV